MNLRQFTYFLAITEKASFQKAAQALFVSQPSISAQIKLLEEELNVQLFERRFDGVVLTPEGHVFLAHAKGVMAAVEATRQSMRVHQSAAVGTVSIGISGSLTSLLTVPLISRALEKFPNIKVRVVSGLSGHISGWLSEGKLDFGLIFGQPNPDGLEIQHLLDEDLFLAARSQDALDELCTDAGLDARKLEGIPLVLPASEHGLRATIDTAASLAEVPLNVIAEVDSSEQLKSMVRATGCFTILSLAALRNDPQPLATVRITNPTFSRTVHLAHGTSRPLSGPSRRVEQLLISLIDEALSEGWWKYAGAVRG